MLKLPSQEYGVYQPFESWELEQVSEYLIAGQMGIYAYQPVPATPTMDLNTLNINAIATALNNSGKVTVKYAKISWNESGSTVTDFVFGFVAHDAAISYAYQTSLARTYRRWD